MSKTTKRKKSKAEHVGEGVLDMFEGAARGYLDDNVGKKVGQDATDQLMDFFTSTHRPQAGVLPVYQQGSSSGFGDILQTEKELMQIEAIRDMRRNRSRTPSDVAAMNFATDPTSMEANPGVATSVFQKQRSGMGGAEGKMFSQFFGDLGAGAPPQYPQFQQQKDPLTEALRMRQYERLMKADDQPREDPRIAILMEEIKSLREETRAQRQKSEVDAKIQALADGMSKAVEGMKQEIAVMGRQQGGGITDVLLKMLDKMDNRFSGLQMQMQHANAAAQDSKLDTLYERMDGITRMLNAPPPDPVDTLVKLADKTDKLQGIFGGGTPRTKEYYDYKLKSDELEIQRERIKTETEANSLFGQQGMGLLSDLAGPAGELIGGLINKMGPGGIPAAMGGLIPQLPPNVNAQAAPTVGDLTGSGITSGNQTQSPNLVSMPGTQPASTYSPPPGATFGNQRADVSPGPYQAVSLDDI